MDQTLLVSHQFNEGVRLLSQLARDQFEVKAAFWVRMAQAEQLRLQIVNPRVDEDGLIQVYTRLHASLSKLPDLDLLLPDIKLAGLKDPLGAEVIGILALHSGSAGVNLGPRLLGGRMIEWGYIYPEHFYHPPAEEAMPAALSRRLFDLIGRGPGPMPASRVALRDGNSFDGVPISFTMGIDRASVQFRVDGEPTPRVVPAEDILAIL